MKILHYSLGLPPYRSGGMARYTRDLVCAQAREGTDQISLLYPGSRKLFGNSSIQRRADYNGVAIYEWIHPRHVALLSGVSDPREIYNPKKRLSIEKERQFIQDIRPDVLHLHTLMGMSDTFLKEAKKLGIRIVFTAHDYYGICSKTVLVDHHGDVCEGENPVKCAVCNAGTPTALHYYLHSQKWLHRHKKVLRKLFGRPERRQKLSGSAKTSHPSPNRIEQFRRLQEYNSSLLNHVDSFHFASTVSEARYRISRDIGDRAHIFPVTHAGISDRRAQHTPSGQIIRIGFIGDSTPYKGYPMLREVLHQLEYEGVTNWILNVHGLGHEGEVSQKRIRLFGAFSEQDLGQVFQGMDLLVVPSHWWETFSLVTLEALSYGVPVMLSDRVGAKDLFPSDMRTYIFSDAQDLKIKLRSCMESQSLLAQAKDSINRIKIPTIAHQHLQFLKDQYNKK